MMASLNEKVSLDNVIIQLLLSERPWPKQIPLSGAYCNTNITVEQGEFLLLLTKPIIISVV
jgi:hypothetical protein